MEMLLWSRSGGKKEHRSILESVAFYLLQHRILLAPLPLARSLDRRGIAKKSN